MISLFSYYILLFQSTTEFLKGLPVYNANNFSRFQADSFKSSSKKPSVYLQTKDFPSEQSKCSSSFFIWLWLGSDLLQPEFFMIVIGLFDLYCLYFYAYLFIFFCYFVTAITTEGNNIFLRFLHQQWDKSSRNLKKRETNGEQENGMSRKKLKTDSPGRT